MTTAARGAYGEPGGCIPIEKRRLESTRARSRSRPLCRCRLPRGLVFPRLDRAPPGARRSPALLRRDRPLLGGDPAGDPCRPRRRPDRLARRAGLGRRLPSRRAPRGADARRRLVSLPLGWPHAGGDGHPLRHSPPLLLRRRLRPRAVSRPARRRQQPRPPDGLRAHHAARLRPRLPPLPRRPVRAEAPPAGRGSRGGPLPPARPPPRSLALLRLVSSARLRDRLQRSPGDPRRRPRHRRPLRTRPPAHERRPDGPRRRRPHARPPAGPARPPLRSPPLDRLRRRHRPRLRALRPPSRLGPEQLRLDGHRLAVQHARPGDPRAGRRRHRRADHRRGLPARARPLAPAPPPRGRPATSSTRPLSPSPPPSTPGICSGCCPSSRCAPAVGAPRPWRSSP